MAERAPASHNGREIFAFTALGADVTTGHFPSFSSKFRGKFDFSSELFVLIRYLIVTQIIRWANTPSERLVYATGGLGAPGIDDELGTDGAL